MASSRSTRPPAKRGGPLRGRHPLAERAIRSAACRGATLVLSCETLADAERARDAAAVVRHSRARRRPSSCGRYDADATVRFRWTERARRRAALPRAKLAKPFQLKFAFSARPTSATRLRRRLETPPSSPPPPPPPPPVAVAHSLARNPGVIGRIARTRRPRRAWSAWRASALDGAASHAERQRRRRRSDSRG